MSAAAAGAIGAVLGWVLGLGLAALLARGLLKPPPWLRVAPILGAVLLAGVAGAMQRSAARDVPVDHLDELVWVQVLKAKYPADYAQLRRRVSSARGFDEASAAVGETLGSVTARQRPKADAASARALFALRYDEGKALQAVDVAGCAVFMDGKGAPASLARVVTSQLAARDRTTVADLLEQTAVRPAPLAPAMPVEDLAQISFRAMKDFSDRDQDFVIDLLRTVRDPVTADETRVICAYHLALAEYLLAKPPAEGGALIRSLWALQDGK